MGIIINPGIEFDLLELFEDSTKKQPARPYPGSITYHEGRQQPFTVWWKGKVIYFTTTRAEAEFQIKVEEARSRR